MLRPLSSATFSVNVGARSLWRAYRHVFQARLLKVLQNKDFDIALLLDKSVPNYPYDDGQGTVLSISQASLHN
jgi:hypothetical protein